MDNSIINDIHIGLDNHKAGEDSYQHECMGLLIRAKDQIEKRNAMIKVLESDKYRRREWFINSLLEDGCGGQEIYWQLVDYEGEESEETDRDYGHYL